MQGKLYLIPTAINNSINNHVLNMEQLKLIQHIQHFIVETPKIARIHLKYLNLTTPIQQLTIFELNKHHIELEKVLKTLIDGQDVGLISDCGLPAIADPGSQIIKILHNEKIQVIPLFGPSSIFLSLMASGLNGQSFAFVGYLPINMIDKKKKINKLEQLVIHDNQTQIFIEAPFRNQQLLQTLIETLSNSIMLCIAINLTAPDEEIITMPVLNWKKLIHQPLIHKKEVIFLIGK